jgi:hypothetical protein
VARHLHRAAAATPAGESAADAAADDVEAWQQEGALLRVLRAVRGAAVSSAGRARASNAPTAPDCATVVGGCLVGAAALRWAVSASAAEVKKESNLMQAAVEALAAGLGFFSAVNSVVVLAATKGLTAPNAPALLPADTAAALKAALAAIVAAAMAQAQQ